MANILLYSHTFYPAVGGMERNSMQLAKLLIGNGYEIRVITSSQSNEKVRDIDLLVIRNIRPFTILKNLIWSDLVFVNGGISLPVNLMAFFLKKPIINIHQMAEPQHPFYKNFKEKLSHKVKKFMSHYATVNIGVSKVCLESKKILGKSRQYVVYNPIDNDLHLPPSKLYCHKKYDLLYAGRVIDGKGVFLLADVLKAIDHKKLNLTVCITGNGVDKPGLEKKLMGLKYVRVNFQGFVEEDLLSETYASSRIMILPSTTHTEGSPLSIAEAFAFGVPVIGSDQPAIKEVIGEAGYTFKSGDKNDLEEKILLLHSNESLLKELSQKAKLRSALFSYKKYEKNILFIVEQVIN